MKKYILVALIAALMFGCKKEKKQPSTASQQPTPTTLPPSNFKRVKMLKQYDTLNFIKKITTTNYEYSYVTGRLATQTTIDSTISNSVSVSTTINTYTYTSFGKTDSYTSATSGYTLITKYVYDASNLPIKELNISVPNLDTTSNTNYYINGNSAVKGVSYSTSGTTYNYMNGDLDSYSIYSQYFTSITVYQATYDPTLIDKSKKNLNETSPLTAACKLLVSEYYPGSPITTTPYTVTYTYTYDADGYPIAYENSKAIKWRVYYY